MKTDQGTVKVPYATNVERARAGVPDGVTELSGTVVAVVIVRSALRDIDGDTRYRVELPPAIADR